MHLNSIIKLANNFYSLATIPSPIRNIKHFLKNYPNKLSKSLNLISQSLLPQSTNDKEQIDNYLIEVFNASYYDVNRLNTRINKIINDSLKWVDNSFNEDLTSKDYFRTPFKNSISFLEFLLNDLIEFKSIFDGTIKFEFAEEGYERYKKYTEYDIDQDGSYFASIKRIPELLDNLCQDISSYLTSLKEYKRQLSSNEPSSSESEEILFHATLNAENIFNHGFRKDPIKTEGLGGSTATKTGKHGISFTSDLYVAKEVARCFKEAIMIANGEINGHDLLEWSSDKESLLKTVKKVHGSELDYFNPVDVFNIYTTYLAMDNRYNPLFFGHAANMVEYFKDKNEKQVGIIAAKVNMNDPDIVYFSAMSEYRVPAEAVISIEKLIK